MSASGYADLLAAVRMHRPRVAFVFGSGLGGLDDQLQPVCEVAFLDVPGLCSPTVAGHKGCVAIAEWSKVPVLVFSGRLHYYEGHAWRQVTQPVQIVHDLGVEALVLTNAAGGIRDDLEPGSLMALEHHLQCTKTGWWRETPPPPAARPYDASLRAQLQQAATALGIELHAGVYAQVTGPCYETKAEIRALRHCGADAVGMSTAREVETAVRLGLRCAAVSCITNRAAGLSQGPIHHGEVLEIAKRVRERLARLLEEFLRNFA